MNTLLDVKKRVRALVGDPDGRGIATDATIVQRLATIYDDAINYLANYSSPNIEKQVGVYSVPAGTTDFSAFQTEQPPALVSAQAGAPLAGLLNPIKLEWKQAGLPDPNYVEARFCQDTLPHIVPGNYINGYRPSWTWRAWIMYVTPLGYPADFLVTGEFRPPPLLKDTDVVAVHPMLVSHLAYAVAAAIGASRGNQTYTENYGARAIQTMDDVVGWLVRKEQGAVTRVGRMKGSRRGFRR